MRNHISQNQLPWSSASFDPGDDGCDHGDYSEGSDADSPDTDAG